MEKYIHSYVKRCTETLNKQKEKIHWQQIFPPSPAAVHTPAESHTPGVVSACLLILCSAVPTHKANSTPPPGEPSGDGEQSKIWFVGESETEWGRGLTRCPAPCGSGRWSEPLLSGSSAPPPGKWNISPHTGATRTASQTTSTEQHLEKKKKKKKTLQMEKMTHFLSREIN